MCRHEEDEEEEAEEEAVSDNYRSTLTQAYAVYPRFCLSIYLSICVCVCVRVCVCVCVWMYVSFLTCLRA